MPAKEGERRAPVILVVDDDDYVHSTLAASLRGFRPAIHRAASGAAALEVALAALPDLAIVDVGLPDIDGYELTRALRARADLPDLRILILTGHHPDERLAHEVGADAILGKPFRLHEFLAVVDVQLKAGASGTPRDPLRREG